jgi:hypothetical protein
MAIPVVASLALFFIIDFRVFKRSKRGKARKDEAGEAAKKNGGSHSGGSAFGQKALPE